MAEYLAPDQIATGDDDLRTATPAERYSFKKKKKSNLMLMPGQSSAAYVLPQTLPKILADNPALLGQDMSWRKSTDTPIPVNDGGAYHPGPLSFGMPNYDLAKQWGPQQGLPQTAAQMPYAAEHRGATSLGFEDLHKPIDIGSVSRQLQGLYQSGQIDFNQFMSWSNYFLAHVRPTRQM